MIRVGELDENMAARLYMLITCCPDHVYILPANIEGSFVRFVLYTRGFWLGADPLEALSFR